MGHSAGGTAALEFCRNDDRCKAVVDLDGWYDHVIGQEPFKQPILLLFASKSIEISEPSASYLARKEITRDQYYEREAKIMRHKQELCKSPVCSLVVIPDASHGDFSDSVLYKWPFQDMRSTDSYATLATINSSIAQFFADNL